MPRGVSAREVADRLHRALREFLDGREPQDDLTLLVLRVTERVAAERAVVLAPEAVAAR